MKATEANLLDLMGVAKMQFVIPVYQRVYSWSVKECEVLWDDVMRAGRDDMPHFVGSMLYIPESERSATSISRVLLIDGQQRMTTFSLMIAALADYLESNPDKAGLCERITSLTMTTTTAWRVTSWCFRRTIKRRCSQSCLDFPCQMKSRIALSRTMRSSAKRCGVPHLIRQGFGRVSTVCRSSTLNSRQV